MQAIVVSHYKTPTFRLLGVGVIFIRKWFWLRLVASLRLSF